MLGRRDFMKHMFAGTLALSSAGALGEGATLHASHDMALPTPASLPRWRGFNLLEKFMMPRNEPFQETDFAWMAEWGFSFARLPMDYRCWTDPDDWTVLKEETLREIDAAVALGRKYGIHVCLNFHRAPGHTVASPAEERDLWIDVEARRVCALHWEAFAKRYAGVPNAELSFNLFNEPTKVKPEAHHDVVACVSEAIRRQDAERLIICDGRMWGRIPPTELLDLKVAGATRGYEPHGLTHYQASWAGSWEGKPVPTYPMPVGNGVWDRQMMRKQSIDPWKALEKQGMGVMVGEFGAFNKTPHAVVMAWMKDCLDLWKEAGWGWALWNLRGSFGILESERPDVAYEDWHGHSLDRRMLELLQSA